jgi:tRNA(Glu) U13 pseudouridine synthase TruD
MWGRGGLRPRLEAAEPEAKVTHEFESVTAALERAGLEYERRGLRLKVEALEADVREDLQVTFRLRAGAFATAVLREIVETDSEGATA